jgi:hypothetical protein
MHIIYIYIVLKMCILRLLCLRVFVCYSKSSYYTSSMIWCIFTEAEWPQSSVIFYIILFLIQFVNCGPEENLSWG